MKFKVRTLISVVTDVFWQNTKTTPDKTPGQKPREQLRENLYRGLLSGFFVLGLLKIGGSDMCDVLSGVTGCVTKCDKGEGGQNWPKIAWSTYFMDGAYKLYIGLKLGITKWIEARTSASFFGILIDWQNRTTDKFIKVIIRENTVRIRLATTGIDRGVQ